ncbi:hypothetical protein OEZ86_011732 [Tetradesmus obliquus]|nr:hypothetical protein OEZ86_011732 [Tetradesmus obliquus]
MNGHVLDAAGTSEHSSVIDEELTAAATADGTPDPLQQPQPATAPLSPAAAAAAAAAAATKPKACVHHPQQPLPHRPPSKRQAHKHTFSRILQHQHEEDAAYAQFEAAVKHSSKTSSRPQAAAQQQQQQQPKPPAPAQPAAAAAGEGEAAVVTKRKRGRPPKPRPLIPILTRPLLYGAHLQSVLAEVRAVRSRALPVGTAVWVKLAGYCAWPALVWSLELCAKVTWPDIITSYVPGKLLVRFYGEHSSSWAAPKQLSSWQAGAEGEKLEALRLWGKRANKLKLVTATIDELEGRADSPKEETSRMARMGKTYQLDALQAAARQRLNALLHPHAPAGSSHAAGAAALAAAAAAAGVGDMQQWTCPACSAANTVAVLPEEELLAQAAGLGATAERMGLTPDWIISTAAFSVFQLPRPTPEQPFIAGLLDPACNSKLEPNIPAEVLYDKRDDGLKPANAWKGYHVLLNPDFRAQVQWKFVNRAIDEVESGNVPAVLLICRNSTDTAYFQRLRPYPRVLLRRSSAKFKDYDKSPIGFGVVVFCIAKHDCRALYERFFEGFAPWGEPNIPIDKPFMASPGFYQLLARLRRHAEQHARDHWVQCSGCGLWRIISWQQLAALKGGAGDWTCSMLRPPHTSCATPQSRVELAGMASLELAAGPGGHKGPGGAGAAAAAGGDAAAAAGGGVAADADMGDAGEAPPAELQARMPLHEALQQHKAADVGPRAKLLLPALEQALKQQAAVAEAEAAALAAAAQNGAKLAAA